MVVVLGIIGLILGAAMTFVQPLKDHAAETATRSELGEITSKLEVYRSNAGYYPSGEQGLAALVERPSAAPEPRRWKQLFLSMPRDSWGREYAYFNPGRTHKGAPEVVSSGVDGTFETEDDLSSQDDLQ